MTTIFFDKDKFSLNITDSNLEGYIRVLPLKDLILIMGEEGLELTVLNKERRFLYTFTEGQVTLEGVNLLGDIMGYHVALGNESNINQSIVQDTLTYIGVEYLYSFEGSLYLYYGENFNVLPTLISSSSLTAGDWMDITEGVVSFSGGEITNEKHLITTLSTDIDGVIYKGIADRLLSVEEGDKFLYNIVDETNEKTLNSSIMRIKPTDFSYLVSKYEDGVSVGETFLEVAIDQIALSTADGTYGNTLSFTSTNTSISAYPNTRNDFPADPPVNLLCTNEDGKIQSYNTGVTTAISMLGTTLKFVNGVLVEYTT